MTLALYMDHHIPVAVTQGLRLRDVDVLTAFEDGAADWKDAELLARATERNRVVYTYDDDFLAITHAWLTVGREFSGLIYARRASIPIGQAVRDLELFAKACDPSELRNRIEFIPLE